jgi:hypothetical protein
MICQLDGSMMSTGWMVRRRVYGGARIAIGANQIKAIVRESLLSSWHESDCLKEWQRQDARD